MSRLFAILVLLYSTCAAAATSDGAAMQVGRSKPVAGSFLVAQRDLVAPFFSHTVIYLLEHDSHGSVGLVLNRPLDKRASELLPSLHAFDIGNFPVYNGGPVNPHVIVLLFRGQYDTDKALKVEDGIYASSNIAMLAELMHSHKPDSELRLYAGQASWEPGQLEQEILDQDWHVVRRSKALLFDEAAAGLWQRLINEIDPPGIVALNPVAN